MHNNSLREATRSRGRELLRSELQLRSYDFIEDLRDQNIKLYYKLVNINYMRDYSINNYLNFNLSYKLTIDYILADYIDK
jgi:predicted adenine nucleotide alpha hydrolase (AANH) superfamily ATPase